MLERCFCRLVKNPLFVHGLLFLFFVEDSLSDDGRLASGGHMLLPHDLYAKVFATNRASKAAASSTTSPSASTTSLLSSSRSSGSGGGGPGIFTCGRCGNSYARPHSLNRHLRFECGVEPKFECPICHKKSKHKHNLMLHMRTHQNR